MEKINKVLLMMIAMAAIMIAAVGIDKGMQAYEVWKWESERLVRYEQAYADVSDMQVTISQLAQDQEAITAFIEENKEYFDTAAKPDLEVQVALQENEPEGGADISGNESDVSGNESGELYDVSGNELEEGGNVSGNALAEDPDVSGNTLLERQKLRGSYMETQMQNKIDREVIAGNRFDFSDISIACLGDSITEAANLSDMEEYQQYSYPTRLKELLDAKNVTNLGIGGSSIGRYWENAFVDRFKEIPEDTDLILVMGGTNDGFCISERDIGTMEERKAGTFIGDLDELMRGLRENYPRADIVFVTPLPNVLHDILRKERDYLLPQTMLVDVIIQLATEYDIPVIDLYNSNMLDTHDAAVIYNYMPDGVHCNENGYSVLAEHLAAELIKLYGGDVQE